MTIRWDLAGLVAASGGIIAAAAFVVSLEGRVSGVELSKAEKTETAALSKSIDAKASAREVGEILGRVRALEGDKNYASLVLAKKQALAEFEAAVLTSKQELARIESEKQDILREIQKETEKVEEVKRSFVALVDERIRRAGEDYERLKKQLEQNGVATLKIESGVIRVTQSKDYNVVFSTNFSEPPTVTFGAVYEEGLESHAAIKRDNKPTQNGFAVRLVRTDKAGWSRGWIYWIAVGK